MRVYLVGNHGGRTAFKITTSRVLSDLTPLFDEVVKYIVNVYSPEGEQSYNVLIRALLREYNIYHGEIDDLENTTKKIKPKDLIESSMKFISDNREEVKFYWKKRKELERRNR